MAGKGTANPKPKSSEGVDNGAPKKKTVQPKPIEVGSEEEAFYLKELEADFKKNDLNFMQAADEPFLAPDKVDNTTLAQQMHKQQMIKSCMAPLMRGISADSITASVGMYLGMAIISKDFAKDFKKSLTDTATAFRLDSVNGKIDKEIGKNGEGTDKGSKLEAKRDALLAKQNHGHLPFTTKTAAMTQLRFTRQAYNAMRQPGANVDEIQEQYETSIASLYERAKKDGVSANALDESARTMVGQLIQSDVKNAVYFSELAYGDVQRSDFTTRTHEVMGKNGVEQVSETVWQGEFHTPDGKPYAGHFTPRRPMSAESHCDAYSGYVYNELCKDNPQGEQAMKESLANGLAGQYGYFTTYMMAHDGCTDKDKTSKSVHDAFNKGVDRYSNRSKSDARPSRGTPVDAPEFDDGRSSDREYL